MSAVPKTIVVSPAYAGDLELVRRALTHDGEAFRLIMQTHNRGLYRRRLCNLSRRP
ncbi:hypothetical protein LJR231_006412 [Phyllobacterium sp. LjRoot231]|uniref:hypothetical protein n=1 Tax=Phyllobacterium sp. LjRoot231 TaxID=3342289 RepID=UPI003ECC7D09